MLKRLSAVAFVLAVGGCASGGVDRGPFSYACAGGKVFSVTFDPAADTMTVTAGGQTRTLPHAMSGSGARYAEGEAVYWSKGRTAQLEGFPGGPYADCAMP